MKMQNFLNTNIRFRLFLARSDSLSGQKRLPACQSFCIFAACPMVALTLSGFVSRSLESGLKERRGNPEPIDL